MASTIYTDGKFEAFDWITGLTGFMWFQIEIQGKIIVIRIGTGRNEGYGEEINISSEITVASKRKIMWYWKN